MEQTRKPLYCGASKLFRFVPKSIVVPKFGQYFGTPLLKSVTETTV